MKQSKTSQSTFLGSSQQDFISPDPLKKKKKKCLLLYSEGKVSKNAESHKEWKESKGEKHNSFFSLDTSLSHFALPSMLETGVIILQEGIAKVALMEDWFHNGASTPTMPEIRRLETYPTGGEGRSRTR